jgi:hypothetical protein
MPGDRSFDHRRPMDEHQDRKAHPAAIDQHEELEREHLERPADAAADRLDMPSDSAIQEIKDEQHKKQQSE